MPVRTIEWRPDTPGSLLPGSIVLIDQTRLPAELLYLQTRDVGEIWTAIKTLQVRGAPAIGIAAAMGVVVAVQGVTTGSASAVEQAVTEAADFLATSRPTAVNLFWALDRMRAAACASRHLSPSQMEERLALEARAIFDEDMAMCRAIGRHGAALLQDGATILTHCNAGGLATSGYGTALAPVYVAAEQGRKIRVFADETRPLLQGARLTAWELMQAGIEVTLICDNMAAHTMKTRRIDAVLVGADRIAANGDTANKVGTYGVALLAKAHGIPFYVLAPSSTFDPALKTGSEIPIEERGSEEITKGFGKLTAPEGVQT
jgi:methylthioribose-1-phosphate isomerase